MLRCTLSEPPAAANPTGTPSGKLDGAERSIRRGGASHCEVRQGHRMGHTHISTFKIPVLMWLAACYRNPPLAKKPAKSGLFQSKTANESGPIHPVLRFTT